MGVISRFATRRFLQRALFATLAGATLGFVIFVAASDGLEGPRGGRVGGDFPAFYGAALILRAGDGPSLYDFTVQRRSQAGLYPEEGSWLPFPYPAFLAVAYIPFTLVSFKSAYVVHTIVMALCCVIALGLLRKHVPPLDAHFATGVAATLTFYPVFRSVVGGQNTPLSLLCAAGTAAALASGREVVAGLWLGAWLFKPQLALPVIALILFAGYRKAFIGVVAAALVEFGTAAAICGSDWPRRWIAAVVEYAPVNLEMDRVNGVAFREVAAHMQLPALGWAAIAVMTVLVAQGVWRVRHQPIALTGMAASAAVLLAPHGLYYDGGLAIIGLASIVTMNVPATVPCLAGAWFLGGLQHFRVNLPVPPMTVLLCAVSLLARSGDRQRHVSHDGPASS